MSWNSAFGAVVVLAAWPALADEPVARATGGGEPIEELVSLPSVAAPTYLLKGGVAESCRLIPVVELACRANPKVTFVRTRRSDTVAAATPQGGGADNRLAAAD